ncbi:uncharacterized protein LOC131217201 [Magnolia sinica]|uniref:uncharacterized protein LOC131217201 n=1 Tax=Magnolia sinica TaxID=86752 RepID=UPI0026597810|nr:uncharacterized protein LOC131217201 [Magnolia sinica]
MPPQPMQQRVNLADLKGQIVKKIGLEQANRYFNYLSRFFGQKVSKSEFDKLCYLTLGRENLFLHNQLVRSILKNASHGKVPPPIPTKEISKLVRVGEVRSPPKEDGYPQSGPSPTLMSAPLIWGNGDVLPMSPRKGRSVVRDRKLWNRPSPLGPNGKTDLALPQSVIADDAIQKGVMENGELNQCDLQRPVEHRQGLAEQPENEGDISLPPAKRQRAKRSAHDVLFPVHNKGPVDTVILEDVDAAEQAGVTNSTRRPLQAPLGIPFCSASVGGARRASPVASSSFASCIDSGELFDTETLRKWMEQIAGAEGLDGVPMACANLLNNGLDAYLKRLIRSCIELVRARSGNEPTKHSVHKQQPHGNPINGVLPGHHMHIQSSGGSTDLIQEPKSWCPISLLDFKVTMELNPQQLGEDWPQLLEKICLYSCEE